MDAADSLLEALAEFEGGLMLVTHNESYLDTLANRLIVFQGETPFLFEGTYQEFLEKIGWDNEDVKSRKKNSRKDERRERAALVAEKSRALMPLSAHMQELEQKLLENEEEEENIHRGIQEATSRQDGLCLAQLGKKLAELERENEHLFEELNSTTIAHDTKAAHYERLLAEYD
jgi:ATP-binding cassette subfamily F protein 3